MVVGPLEDEDGVLLWVHTGTATVDAGGTSYELGPDTAVWVPAGIEHITRTAPGAVVLPMRLPTDGRPASWRTPRVVPIPDGWSDWLIHQWDDNSSTRDPVPGADALVDLVAQSSVPDLRRAGPPPPPVRPRSREAGNIARSLLLTPGSPHTVQSFAAAEQITVKTLQRRFVSETGLSFSEWRTRARIAIAARLLDNGSRIGETGRAVGYSTAAGFTRAFRTFTGMSPRQYTRRSALIHSAGNGASGADPFEGSAPTAPPIPARTFWEKTYDHHELMWVHRGTATIRIGNLEWAMRTGQALWIPAGLTHTIHISAGSLLLTLGHAHGRLRVTVDDLVVFYFPPEAQAVLLHTMVSEFTLFQPKANPGALVQDLFHQQSRIASSPTERPTGALGEMATALRRNPADPRTLTQWAAHLRTTPQHLRYEILSQAGQGFPQWRSRLKMDVARELLRVGDPPGQIYRRLGYSSAAALSRAFKAAHGITAREYQRREESR